MIICIVQISSKYWKRNKILAERLGFINQHDGDIILDLVKEFALIADQTIPRII
jgi:hypothetical protein